MALKDKILIATFAALTAVGAFIRIPIPYVPITMQYFFCGTSAVVLGAKKGAYSQILYVIIGLIGVPVFTNGGGMQYVFQPTFGYLIGFIAAAYVIGVNINRRKTITVRNIFTSNIYGLIVLYIIGVGYFYFINNIFLNNHITLAAAVYYGFLTTITGDILTALLISIVAVRIKSCLNISD